MTTKNPNKNTKNITPTEQRGLWIENWSKSQALMVQDPVQFYTQLVNKRKDQIKKVEERMDRARSQIVELESKLSWAERVLRTYDNTSVRPRDTNIGYDTTNVGDTNND